MAACRIDSLVKSRLLRALRECCSCWRFWRVVCKAEFWAWRGGKAEALEARVVERWRRMVRESEESNASFSGLGGMGGAGMLVCWSGRGLSKGEVRRSAVGGLEGGGRGLACGFGR